MSSEFCYIQIIIIVTSHSNNFSVATYIMAIPFGGVVKGVRVYIILCSLLIIPFGGVAG